jgi:peptidoglycan/LPS O-acetylase OafA/YrhL
MKYRADIDGLRGISVLVVILFHVGFQSFRGGYVGVDVFFVISGYLITMMVLTQARDGQFRFVEFYQRRVARLLPALILTLGIVFLFGFVFYDNLAFDNLGKELFFSSFGISNFLFAQGTNYFASEARVRPLIHMWSLGVEEQFYVMWPITVRFLAPLRRWKIFVGVALLGVVSLLASSIVMHQNSTAAYFLPQYRAFELILGALAAIFTKDELMRFELPKTWRASLSIVGLMIIIITILVYDDQIPYPGYYALIPCIGALFVILFAENTPTTRLLTIKPLVSLGLISYPLYLFHLPIISVIEFFTFAVSPIIKFLIVFGIGIPISIFVYQKFEIPARTLASQPKRSAGLLVGALIINLILIAGAGMAVAKSDGLGWRFKYLNPFAYKVSVAQEFPFIKKFSEGYQIDAAEAQVLFIGDSSVEQYVIPIIEYLGVSAQNIDTVTRGGCILLKGVDYIDEYDSSSCSDLRTTVFVSKKKYDLIVISQHWSMYSGKIQNVAVSAATQDFQLKKWESFLADTLEHYRPYTNAFILVGGHPTIRGTESLTPHMFITEEQYSQKLEKLQITNLEYLKVAKHFFEINYGDIADVYLLHPQNIWCQTSDLDCKLHNGQLSFFRDDTHLTVTGTDYAVSQLPKLLPLKDELLRP